MSLSRVRRAFRLSNFSASSAARNDSTPLSRLTAYALEQKFSSASQGVQTASSSLWKKYSKGTATPGKTKKSVGLIERVELAYPGTARIFRHPLWDALDRRVLTHIEVHQLFMGLPFEYRSRILAEFGGARFWRSPDVGWPKLSEVAGGPSADRLRGLVTNT